MKTAHASCLAQHKKRGFTLIELMVVVAIVAIMAAIAIPSYKKQIVKTNRNNAMAVLQGAAQAMERYYAQNNTYAGAALGTAAGAVYPAQSPLDGAARYNLTLSNLSATTYTIVATPIGSQVGDGFIQLTNTGERDWDQNNNGAIDANEKTWTAN